MDTLMLERTVTAGINTPKVCPLCGNIEPELWYDAPMNETIRGYARDEYVIPVRTHYLSLWDALEAIGATEGLEHDSSD
uniref:Uncharacterized protein n=2 Tax=unclassified bacterial viruses TaxID=12333 RepID=A0AAU6VZM2_9VIRU